MNDEIWLPVDASELGLHLAVSEHVSTEPAEVKGNCKEEEAELYKNYTIQALHAPRQNQKVTDLYQMLCITEPAIVIDVNSWI